MINVRELMYDLDFCTKYAVLRTKGNWVKGRFVLEAPRTLRYFGPVQPATEKELEQIPEGDRSHGIMKFMCASPREIYISQASPSPGAKDITVSDQIIYAGKIYKIIKVKHWDANGYLRAFGYAIGNVQANG